jgi:hypothetical protein
MLLKGLGGNGRASLLEKTTNAARNNPSHHLSASAYRSVAGVALQRCLGPRAGRHSWRHPDCGFDSGTLRQDLTLTT